MSENSLNLVVQKIKNKHLNDMAKIIIKSEKLTPFGGIFHVMELFERLQSPIIDKVLGLRCSSFGYNYSEIIRSLMCVYFCGGSCTEDVSSHLLKHLRLHPRLRSCSSDTILRAITERTCKNTTYTSESGKKYDFNTADKLNDLLLDLLITTGQLKSGESYDLDFDHEFLETEKYDTKMTYKHFLGYSPGVATIGDLITGIENRDGNANVRFNQRKTLHRFFIRYESRNLHIRRFRADCGSCSEDVVKEIVEHCDTYYIRANRCQSMYDQIFSLKGWKTVEINGIEYELNSILVEKWKCFACRLIIQRQKRPNGEQDIWEGEYTYRCIMTNDYISTPQEIVEFYNKRGGQERIFDDLDNGFGWKNLPKSFMSENTVFLLITAMIRNFYTLLLQNENLKAFGLKPTSRIKAFVFKFISVPAKWIRTARSYHLNIYTDIKEYATVFKTEFG